MKFIELYPELEGLRKLDEFLHEELNIDNQDVRLVAEELFVNIINYSKCSHIVTFVKLENDILTMEFVDDGIEFNPTSTKPPELADNIDDAEIGGLGIHLVKNLVDEMHYEYKDNENHLTIIKNVKT